MMHLYTKSDVYAYQLLHFFITRYQYQMVRIQNQKNDYWLMNINHSEYPVICISNEEYNESHVDEEYLRNVQRAILDIIGREGRLLLLNTNSSSTTFRKDYVKHCKAEPHSLKDVDVLKNFNGIDQVLHDVADEQMECAALLRSIEEYESVQSKKNKHKIKIKIPRVTAAIAIISVVYFLIIQGAMLYFKDMATGIIAGGGYYKMLVVAMGEYWRIFTTGFLHYDIFHLFVNVYTLFAVGMMCEKLYQEKQYIVIFLASLFIGNIFAFVAAENIVNVGISPGIFGVTAAFIAVLVENQSIKLPIVRSSAMRILFLNVLLMMMPNTSMVGNIGAIVTGGFLGVIFSLPPSRKSIKINTVVSFLMLVMALGYFALQVQRIEPIDSEMDTSIIQGFEKAGWTGYADKMKEKFQIVYEREMVK